MEAGLAILTGWGRVRKSASVTLRPDGMEDVLGAFDPRRKRANGMIAQGAGRAYGDCALNEQGSVLLSLGLNQLIGFDPETGIVEVEPGVTFRALIDAFLPLGFLVPVSPGTGFATIGGAVANDVHGKNHEREGSFCAHVTSLDLLTPDGHVRCIGPGQEDSLFLATCGGLGLTGIILRVAFRLKKVAGPAVAVTRRRVADLEGFLGAMQESVGASYSVGWIDGTARGRTLGRGIWEVAEPADGAATKAQRGVRVPFDFPDVALNPLSIRLFNAVYVRSASARPRTTIAAYEKFFYPLDTLLDWNRIYGRRGFHQFQNVVPLSAGKAALRDLLEVIAASGRASFLAVLKRLGPGCGAAGPLSFPMEGYTLALDFPAGAGIEDLYARLVTITLRYGGRVYLAKDALLDVASFREMYPAWQDFLRSVEAVDPLGWMQSDMSRRLQLRG